MLTSHCKGRYTRGSLLPQHAPATRSRSKAPSSAPTISSEKICYATKLLFHEQAPSCVLKFALQRRVSGASSLVCTEICFAGACFRSKLRRVYWLGYLPGSVFRERVSGASSFVCTGWSTYPGACFGSMFQEQAPSCVPALTICQHIIIYSTILVSTPNFVTARPRNDIFALLPCLQEKSKSDRAALLCQEEW